MNVLVVKICDGVAPCSRATACTYVATACRLCIRDPRLKLLSTANELATNTRLYVNTWKDGTTNGLRVHAAAGRRESRIN